jgi:hypothetical protein
MKIHHFKLRKIKNSHYFLDSWTQFNLVGSFIYIFFPLKMFLWSSKFPRYYLWAKSYGKSCIIMIKSLL